MDYKKLREFSHTFSVSEALALAESTNSGIPEKEALVRLDKFGKNQVPDQKSAKILVVFFKQFKSPFIYILLVAASLSYYLDHPSDTLFILGILVINAVIGTIQEYGAQRSVESLRELTTHKITVSRAGKLIEIDASNLAPGDVFLVESGIKIPADGRVIQASDLRVDESLLTGESVDVSKRSELICEYSVIIGERKNMVFAGTIVTKGRARILVTSTAQHSQLGNIAQYVTKEDAIKTPLILRMETFTMRLAGFLGIVVCLIGIVLFMRGTPLEDVLILAVAIGVGAIPEGLPVAMTVALSLAARRMAKRNVIVRQLASVEALGSCTYIGTDKTGTLTMNKLTAQIWVDRNGNEHEIGKLPTEDQSSLINCFLAASFSNESIQTPNGIKGDMVDIALKNAIPTSEKLTKKINSAIEISRVPYESQLGYCASVHRIDNIFYMAAKGAPENFTKLKANSLLESALDRLTSKGYKAIALALERSQTSTDLDSNKALDFEVVGLVGLIDPPREDAEMAIVQASQAGIKVGMITGDHPKTSYAIAQKLGIANNYNEVCAGSELRSASENEFDHMVKTHTVFARVEPGQKYNIAKSLIKQGHFLAITGDGANDAPALKTAHVGVAMGKSGTDLAKETSQLIITDDKFSSIIAGIEEGRVAYSNIRKVIYLLISTGGAEIIIFTLCVIFNTPIPLTAVQILWLNLVTNGIQDVALAFEPKEGDELKTPPRDPKERIFNKLMIKRVLLSSIVVGLITFYVFNDLLNRGMPLVEAQNHILLLMVLFENVMVGNARSEKHSGLKNILRNPFLIYGTILAQLVHIVAMHYGPFANSLGLSPIPIEIWFKYLLIATSVFIVIELQKLFSKRS